MTFCSKRRASEFDQKSVLLLSKRTFLKNVITVGWATSALIGSGSLSAASLPDSYPLNHAEAIPNPMDPALQSWIEEHADKTSVFEMESKEFTELVAKQDAITQHFLLLGYANRGGSGVDAAKVLASFEKQLAADTAAKRNLNHPLLPFVYLEIMRTKNISAESAALAMAGMKRVGGGSCAEKKFIFDELNRNDMTGMSDDELKVILSKIDAYHSLNFRKTALRRFLEALPNERQQAVAATLLPMVAPYPSILNDNAWLKPQSESGKKDFAALSQKSFADSREAARKHLCSSGRDLLLVGLSQTKTQDSLSDALAAAKSVGDCFRQRGAELRRDFWRKMEVPLEQSYGFQGKAEARLSLGYLYWAVDDFTNSKAIFSEIMAAAAQEKNDEIESKALFALGRIAENEGDMDKAAVYYEDYTKRFPTKENFENALMAAVLLHIDKQAYDEALIPLSNLIKAQTMLPVDQRSVGALSFALFWAGRIYVEKGEREKAMEMWRRVASEFYSTYYGAIGHYMLEQISSQKLALQPSRAAPFKMQKLIQTFDQGDKTKVQRVEMLLRLGLKNDGICELEEMSTADGKPEKVLIRSLMFYASGEWLNAIKAYDSLPRGFRNGLPVGFERILFPRRFVDTIRKYASKAEVDPDLVMAIIRQESVFNPAARSPVGAMGLMQLMPATAGMEVKRLAPQYLDAKERNMLRQQVREERNLLVPETNLIVGIHHLKTLLAKYISPIFVLSAYNASPSAAQRWKNSIPSKDVLAFIERIPYRETRAYVKLVLRNYFYYKRWYDSPMEKLNHLDMVTSPLVAMVKPAEVKPELPGQVPLTARPAAALQEKSPSSPIEGNADGATPNH